MHFVMILTIYGYSLPALFDKPTKCTSVCNYIIKTCEYISNMKYNKISKILGILLYFKYYTFLLLCGLPDDDL
jgi:hypothetical protein